jgi:hypothetical protein
MQSTQLTKLKKLVKYGLTIIKVGSMIISYKKLDPTLNTSSKPCLQKVVPCRHPCHTHDLELGTWRPVSICIVKISHWSKRQNYSSSLHTRRRIPKDSKISPWMKNLHEFPHGKLWMMFHGLLEITSNPPPRSRPSTKSCRPC